MRCARARRLISLRGGADFFPVFFSRACVGGVSQPQSTPGTLSLSLSLSLCVFSVSLFLSVCVFLSLGPLGLSAFSGLEETKKKKLNSRIFSNFTRRCIERAKKKEGRGWFPRNEKR